MIVTWSPEQDMQVVVDNLSRSCKTFGQDSGHVPACFKLTLHRNNGGIEIHIPWEYYK